jgi:hypothetical protein
MIGDKPYWCAIGKTKFGTIPGMADADGVCTFEYKGKQTTKDFKYVLGQAEKDSTKMKYEQPQP